MPAVKERLPKLPKMPNMTTMYSVNKETGVVVVHRLPYQKGHVLLESYEKKGFTYERPAEPTDQALLVVQKALDEAPISKDVGVNQEAVEAIKKLLCDFPECGFIAKTEWGLTVHKRKHNREEK